MLIDLSGYQHFAQVNLNQRLFEYTQEVCAIDQKHRPMCPVKQRDSAINSFFFTGLASTA